MRIESIRIENFGKLQNFSLDLNSGLNVIHEENGWGKSTLTAFIRVMFYGFEGENKHKGVANERSRYAPWQGGIYGGNIVFETKGQKYSVTRRFGAKKTEDFFEIRNAQTNLISTDFSEELGRELFHINSESFMKTVFVGQNESAATDSTDDINSKIGNISDSTDMNKYRVANEAFNNAINKLSDRKTGERGKTKESITLLQSKIYAANGIEQALDEINARLSNVETALEEINKEQQDLNAKRSKSQGLSEILQARNEYERLQAEVYEKRLSVDNEKKWFPLDVPTAERVEMWEKYQDNMNSSESVAKSVAMTEEEENELRTLSSRFVNNTPDEVINGAMFDKAKELVRMRNANMETALSKAESEKLNLYGRMFEGCSDPVRDINTVTSNYNRACQLNERATFIEEELQGLEAKYRAAKRNNSIFAAFGVLAGLIFIVLGGATFIPIVKEMVFADFSSQIVLIIGVLLVSIGLGIFVISFVAGFANGNLKRDGGLIAERKNMLTGLRAEAANLYNDTNSYLVSNRFMNMGGDISSTLLKLLNNAVEYRNLKSQYDRFSSQDNSKTCNEISRGIKDYLSGFGLYADEIDYQAQISYLGSMMERFSYLYSKKKQAERMNQKSVMSAKDFKDQLELFGFETEGDLNLLFSNIRKHLQLYFDASTLLSDAIVRLNKFENSHNMEAIRSDVSQDDYIAPEDFEIRQELLDRRKLELENARRTDVANLDAMEEQYEDYLENLRMLEEKQNRLNLLTEKYSMITLAQKYLGKAKENMTSRYVTPLKQGFDKYLGMMSSESGEEYYLDANLVLTKEEAGLQRKKEYLSYGYQDMLGLCMRLSMADTMYSEEKPMLILDDPFVNLDDEKMRAATGLLGETSKEYQILYLTCREERLSAVKNVG